MGNVTNRVFDSAGPESKVRGTPQQIIEKYQMLARDAQLSGDRVAAENFLQHAEHYSRMLSEVQREQAERQQEEAQNRPPQQQQHQNQNQNQQDEQPRIPDEQPSVESGFETFGLVDQTSASDDLVATPESAARQPSPRARTRRPAKPKSDAGGDRSPKIQDTAAE